MLDTGEVENGKAAAAGPDGLGATNLTRYKKHMSFLSRKSVRVVNRIEVARSIQVGLAKQLLQIRRA